MERESLSIKIALMDDYKRARRDGLRWLSVEALNIGRHYIYNLSHLREMLSLFPDDMLVKVDRWQWNDTHYNEEEKWTIVELNCKK